MKKRILAVILMFALFLSTSYAANEYRKTIQVSYGINVEFNGRPIDMTDADGYPVDAFVYQGTTYVPIRAVSETFGADVGYDAPTKTAIIDFSSAPSSDSGSITRQELRTLNAIRIMKEECETMSEANSFLLSFSRYASDPSYQNLFYSWYDTCLESVDLLYQAIDILKSNSDYLGSDIYLDMISLFSDIDSAVTYTDDTFVLFQSVIDNPSNIYAHNKALDNISTLSKLNTDITNQCEKYYSKFYTKLMN